jgi:hypothetical protein
VLYTTRSCNRSCTREACYRPTFEFNIPHLETTRPTRRVVPNSFIFLFKVFYLRMRSNHDAPLMDFMDDCTSCKTYLARPFARPFTLLYESPPWSATTLLTFGDGTGGLLLSRAWLRLLMRAQNRGNAIPDKFMFSGDYVVLAPMTSPPLLSSRSSTDRYSVCPSTSCLQ